MNNVCINCATLEGSDLVMEYFEDRFLKAHPEIATLAMVEGELGTDVIWEAADQMADAGDPIALDFIVAVGLWCTIGEDLAQPDHD